MGKGNDGLEGKWRQRAASLLRGEGRKSDCPETAGCDANVSSCCHSLDSFVVKMAAGERGEGIQRRFLSLTFILLLSRARTSDGQKKTPLVVYDEWART